MSYVEIPFGKVAPTKRPTPKPVLVEIGLQGRLKLWAFSGEYEIEFDGKPVPAPRDEKGALNRFRDLSLPKTQSTTETQKVTVEPEKTAGEHSCPVCGAQTSNDRTKLVGTELCPKCTPQAGKVFGVMDYSHKTGGVLMVTTNQKHFQMMRRPINKQR